MFFCFQNTSFPSPVKVEIISGPRPAKPAPGILYIEKGQQRFFSFEGPGRRQLLLLGDPIFPVVPFPAGQLFTSAEQLSGEKLLEEVRGHYYWFLLDNNSLICGSSFGAIYPIYYREDNSRIAVSSSSLYLSRLTGASAGNRRNLLERLLFNYPFFDSTWWKDIRLLGTHQSLLCGEGRMETNTILDPLALLPERPDPTGGRMADLVRLFDEEVRLFFPDEPFAVSMTGGFDGRTLVAAARRQRRSFSVYSFGRPETADIAFPARQCKALHLAYQPVLLDQAYLDKEALPAAFSFLEESEYNGNLGRPHYHYAARLLSRQTSFILTGNFGSELFRALHLPGVLMSESLIRLFGVEDDSWKDFLRAQTIAYSATGFEDELDALIADLERYLHRRKGWAPNHRLYDFVSTELFRKYFGPELVVQSRFLNNRTPFLSLHFVRQLHRTAWSGLHSRIFEKQKAKRLKGQQFYAAYLRFADPPLYQMPTSKGYSPADVLEKWRIPILLSRLIQKKIAGKSEPDENAVLAFFQQHFAALTGRADHANENQDFLWGEAFTKEGLHDGTGLPDLIKICSVAAGWRATTKQHVPIDLINRQFSQYD